MLIFLKTKALVTQLERFRWLLKKGTRGREETLCIPDSDSLKLLG